MQFYSGEYIFQILEDFKKGEKVQLASFLPFK